MIEFQIGDEVRVDNVRSQYHDRVGTIYSDRIASRSVGTLKTIGMYNVKFRLTGGTTIIEAVKETDIELLTPASPEKKEEKKYELTSKPLIRNEILKAHGKRVDCPEFNQYFVDYNIFLAEIGSMPLNKKKKLKLNWVIARPEVLKWCISHAFVQIQHPPIPCPFCGSEELRVVYKYIKCVECGAKAKSQKWNHRIYAPVDIYASPERHPYY